jgi:hypothetical protein
MVKPWLGWLAAILVTLVAAALVVADIADSGVRHWWASHALTSDTVSGLLVLAITVQIVNQVVRRRQLKAQSLAIAAQAGIMVNQAGRSVRAVSAALDGSGERGPAADEVRTYMMMLLVSAPVLIDARVSRTFLEQAQHLGGEMAHTLTTLAKAKTAPAHARSRLDAAVQGLRDASAPLMLLLSPEERSVATGEDAA